MNSMIRLFIVCCAGATAQPLTAAELKGTVRSTAGNSTEVVLAGDLVPAAGDKATIFFTIPGGEDEVVVATASVAGVGADSVQLKVENATGTVAKDQQVRITSANPQKRGSMPATPQVNPGQPQQPPGIAAGSTNTASGTVPPFQAPEPPFVTGLSYAVTFDKLNLGKLPGDAFAARGIRIAPGEGIPGVYEAEAAYMTLPPPCKKVMLLADRHVTLVTIKLDPPASRFALYRIGVKGGASTPPWTMTAYDAEGKELGSTGEKHGFPAEPKYFDIDGPGIVRVEIKTDNRSGNTTLARWSSLPIAAFGFSR